MIVTASTHFPNLTGLAAGQVFCVPLWPSLPTVRALAVQLKVNLNTVSKAYRELEIRNILETQQGTGTFIGSVAIDIPAKEREKKLKNICTEFFNIAASYGFSVDEIIRELGKIEGGIK